ncbi:MAG: hypothetical protein Q9193_000824 [Seirophora villosa]
MSEYVHATFAFIPLEVRKAVAVYDAFQMAMDDVPDDNNSLDHLCSQLATSEGVSHPAWKEFFKFLPNLFQHYGPYAQTTLLRGALEFMQATCLERTLFKGYPESKYPDYLRRMSAQGPVQAVVCFPESEFPQERFLPIIATIEAELEYFVGTVNDLFSFYKESENPFERTNYPLTQSACTQQGVAEVLHECLEAAIACQDRVMQILAGVGDGSVLRRVKRFFIGYTRYHLACPRYKIASLCKESGNETLAHFHKMSCRTMGTPVESSELVHDTTPKSRKMHSRSKAPSRQDTRPAKTVAKGVQKKKKVTHRKIEKL